MPNKICNTIDLCKRYKNEVLAFKKSPGQQALQSNKPMIAIPFGNGRLYARCFLIAKVSECVWV